MAENETLDVSNRRFRWVVSDLLRGLSAVEIGDRLIRKYCAAWSYILRHGFDAVKIIELTTAGRSIADAIRDTGGSDLAHLIRLHARPFALPAEILDDVHRAGMRQVIESGLQQAMSLEHGPSVPAASALKQQLMAQIEPRVQAITDALLNGRGNRIRLPKLSIETSTVTGNRDIPVPANILQVSLLAVGHRLAQEQMQ